MINLTTDNSPPAAQLQLLIDNGADFDRARKSDGSRLLDRLISEHCAPADRLSYIDCLLQNGAKLGSSTWLAANGKRDVQLRLLRKLCQDGYFLYKVSSKNGLNQRGHICTTTTTPPPAATNRAGKFIILFTEMFHRGGGVSVRIRAQAHHRARAAAGGRLLAVREQRAERMLQVQRTRQ